MSRSLDATNAAVLPAPRTSAAHSFHQTTFDELGLPLSEATFVVVDLETTGGAPRLAAITEIGAVKVKGGVAQGEFQTLVHPGEPIPPFIAAGDGSLPPDSARCYDAVVTARPDRCGHPLRPSDRACMIVQP